MVFVDNENNTAAIYAEPGTLKIEIKDVAKPVPAAGQILVRLYISPLHFAMCRPSDAGQDAYGRLPFRFGDLLPIMANSSFSHFERCGMLSCSTVMTSHETNTYTGQVGGHEGVGEVVGLGPEVSEPKLGSRVGIKWLADVCGSCGKFQSKGIDLIA